MPPQAKSSDTAITVTNKERRDRNREAQQQFRKRKQEANDLRFHRLKSLEWVIEKMSTVVSDFTDQLLQNPVVLQYPDLITTIQDVIRDVLALANEAGDPEDAPKVRKARGKSVQMKKGVAEGSKPIPDVSQSPIDATVDSALLCPGNQDVIPDPTPVTQTFPMQNPLVEFEGIPLEIMTPDLYLQTADIPSTIPQSLGPILWTTPKHFLPNSFNHRLTYSCFNAGGLVLSRSVESPIPWTEESRMFGSTFRYRQKEEMINRIKWLLGPGKDELQDLALLPWGGRWWDQEFSSDDLASCATAASMIDSSAPQFLSVVGVEKQLKALGARSLEKETVELNLAILSGNRREPLCIQPESWSFVNLFPSKMPRQRFTSPTVHVSVISLIENLTKIAVCLMKGPGFPKQALKWAIEESVIMNGGHESWSRDLISCGGHGIQCE
ncbi:hypothetical protein FAVG1_07852 [Fusarium avenaceum]|nr:hypothetical protein FAVG1_07852 [Fusarium avenaceum]